MRALVDTSVWINHLKSSDSELIELLEADMVVTHAVVIGELACGQFRKRSEFLGNLKMLDRAPDVLPEEVLEMVEKRRLFGKGLGWSDCQLLAGALLGGFRLFSKDRTLMSAAKSLGCA